MKRKRNTSAFMQERRSGALPLLYATTTGQLKTRLCRLRKSAHLQEVEGSTPDFE